MNLLALSLYSLVGLVSVAILASLVFLTILACLVFLVILVILVGLACLLFPGSLASPGILVIDVSLSVQFGLICLGCGLGAA